jgi:hypothetical protein
MREECGKYGTSFRLTFILAYKNNSHQWCRNLAITSYAIDDQVRCTQGNAVHATSAYIVQMMQWQFSQAVICTDQIGLLTSIGL